ncbi:MAG TPA: ribonuclease HII [Spirochaetota bacterium]|jgi:ribonuclease HII|nr:ribonuclease HII [Spirochaetota bacterium]
MGEKPDFALEVQEYKKGCTIIGGIDEAGRGSLAGPLAVCMVIYPCHLFVNPPGDVIGIVNDSKKLSHKKRLAAKEIIIAHCLWWKCVLIPHNIIDEKNINGATYYAIVQLLQNNTMTPDMIFIDGNFSFPLPIPYRSIIKGDNLSLTIASASIIAKVTRDEFMDKLDADYPAYGFAHHKGYGTREHVQAIYHHGPSPVHRKTYQPVAGLLAGGSTLSG